MGVWRVSRTGLATLLALLAMAGTARVAFAGELTLTIRDGRVSLVATDVPISQILTEWARVGGTTVIDADKITGALVSLTLEQVPEAQALATVLRSVSGYLAAPRPIGSVGASRFDRILILASSRAPTRAVATPAQRATPPPIQPRLSMPAAQVGGIGAARPNGLPGAPGIPNPGVDPVDGQPLRQLLPQGPGAAPQEFSVSPGNPFLRPQTPDNPAPQTASRPGIIINPPQGDPPRTL